MGSLPSGEEDCAPSSPSETITLAPSVASFCSPVFARATYAFESYPSLSHCSKAMSHWRSSAQP